MAYLKFLNSIYESKTYFFTDECTIGRSSENTIFLDDNKVSRKHAVIKLSGDYYGIEDLGSKNGVFVRGLQLAEYVPKPLYDGDTIRIADFEMVFNAEGKEPPGGRAQTEERLSRSPKSVAPPDMMNGISVIIKKEEPEIVPKNATIDIATNMLEVGKDTTEKELVSALKRFQVMAKIGAELGTVTESHALLEKIMTSIFDVFPHAERSFIMLRKENTLEMEPAAARRNVLGKTEEERFEVSQTIVKSVIEKKQSVLSSNALQDERFAGGQSIADFCIRSLMYVPFIYKDEILGMITVDTTSREHAFDRDDLAMLTGIAGQAAVALKNVQLYQEVKRETQMRTHLSRYLSSDLVEGVLEGKISFRLGGEEKYGTVLFSDIVGFTTLSESLSAVEVIERLNRYFTVVTDIVVRNNGTLHKFEGDMLMAFWNVLIKDDKGELNAVTTGLQIQKAVWVQSLEFEAEGCTPIYVGVGCNTGLFAGGNVGSKDKMEYTVIGDNINVAKRIESLSGRWQIFVSESTYDAIKGTAIAIGLPPAVVKGKTHPVKIYSVRGIALRPEVLLLAVPVVLKDPAGNFTIRGMLSACTGENGTPTMELYACCQVRQEQKLDIKFFLPESDREFGLAAVVKSFTSRMHNEKHLYAQCILTEIKAWNDTLQFLTPGSFTESAKLWDDMRRK